jgi:hypothetical protein
MLRAVLLLAAAGSAHAKMGWVKSSTTNMCAGIMEECDSIETCTLTAFGPCTDASKGAYASLQSTFVGLAFVEDGYLTDASKAKVVDPDESGTNGYRDSAQMKADGYEYAYTMTGGRYGDMSQVGGYMGIASYFNTGSKAIETNEVTLHTSDDENKNRVTDKGTGVYGAPMRDFQACISEVSGGKCGAKRSFGPGDYKFSIFGWTKGPNFPPPKGSDGFPQYTHLGVRMQLKAVGFKPTDLKINGDKTLENIGSTDVTSITIITGDDTMKLDFPKKYNYGKVGSGKLEVPDGTKDVGIKVSAAGDSAIYIDYLFDTTDLATQLRYFIYDPDVSVETKKDASKPVDSKTPGAPAPATPSTPADTPAADSAFGVSTVVAALLSAAALVFA